MKQNISNSIRSAITRHLITHVQLPKGEGRCRLDILVDEASDEIIKLLSNPELIENTLPPCAKCGMPCHPVLGAVCAMEDCIGKKK